MGFEYKKLSFTSDDVNIQDNIISIQDHGFSTDEEVLYTWSAGIGTTVGGTIVGLSSGTFYYVSKVDSNNFKLSTVKNTANYVDFTSSNNYTTYYECTVKHDAFIEWYEVQKKIYESVK